MTEKLEKTIKEEISQLPVEMQTVINASGWLKTAENIGLRHDLSEDEIEDLQLETLLLLVGATDPEYYATNIENHVNTTKESAETLANEAFREIFAPLNKTLLDNIKKSEAFKNPGFREIMDFILSGGNYSSFIEEKEPVDAPNQKGKTTETIQKNLQKTFDMKENFTI